MKRWTKDEEEFVRACCEIGWTQIEIANELDRTRMSINQKTYNMGISNGLKHKLNTTEQYIKELKIKCPTMICLETYKGVHIKILHKCLNCGKEYKCKPKNKLKGNTCIYCCHINNGGGIPKDKQGITYLVYIIEYDLYKFGITSKTIKERMQDNGLSDSKYIIILERKFSKGISAMKLEKVWKENLKEYLVNTGLLYKGNTETFRI